jgi:hypothetical protein
MRHVLGMLSLLLFAAVVATAQPQDPFGRSYYCDTEQTMLTDWVNPIGTTKVLWIMCAPDSGITWREISEAPFYGLNIEQIAFSRDGHYLYAGLGKYSANPHGGLWRWSISDAVSIRNAVPADFEWSMAPNPFNSITQLSFSVSRTENIALHVFNVDGQVVRTLINERLSPGEHTVHFDGAHLPSGIYFCRLQTPSFMQTRKMVLVK